MHRTRPRFNCPSFHADNGVRVGCSQHHEVLSSRWSKIILPAGFPSPTANQQCQSTEGTFTRNTKTQDREYKTTVVSYCTGNICNAMDTEWHIEQLNTVKMMITAQQPFEWQHVYYSLKRNAHMVFWTCATKEKRIAYKLLAGTQQNHNTLSRTRVTINFVCKYI